MEILFLIGRILYGGFFLMMSMNHFMKADMLSGYAASKGIPSPKIAVALSGLFIFLGGLGVLLGAYVQIALALIAVFLLVVSFTMHNFWAVQDPQQKMLEMTSFLKNAALLGAALMLLFVAQEPWPMSFGL